jgi:hypothetical protein
MLEEMKRRRVFDLRATVLSVLGVAGAWVVACSSYGEDTVAADAGVEEAATSDGSSGDGNGERLDANVNTDVEITKDGGAKIDASACQATECDCDKDGFHKVQSGCDASALQKNVDCDDSDTRYRPDQGFLTDLPEPPRNGDWNCNGAVEKLFEVNVTCTNFLVGGCGKQGFRGDPACGASDTYVSCTPNGPTCKEGTTEVRKQACR